MTTKQTTIRLSSPLLRVLREGNKAQQSIQSQYKNDLQLLIDNDEPNLEENAFTRALDEIRSKYMIENEKDSKGNTKYKLSEEGNKLASQLRVNMERASKALEYPHKYTVKYKKDSGTYTEQNDWPETKKESELVKMMKEFVKTKDENLGNDIVVAVQVAILERLELEEMADELDKEYADSVASIGEAESKMQAKRREQQAA